MIIREVEIKPFTIELNKPFKNANTEIASRQGFIIKIIDELGRVGYGEISPFPGLSMESIESIVPIVKTLEKKLINLKFSDDVFQSIVDFPSVNFGLSQALHSIFILREGMRLDLNCNATISVNGIIGIQSPQKTLKNVEKLIKNGFETIKIKVGYKDIEDDLENVKLISQNFSSNIKYRLDANGKWDIDKALYAVEHLENINIEYLEQPVKELSELIQLSKISKIPIAVDESIRSKDDVELIIELSNIQYFVLKPSIMGSLESAIDLIKLIEAKNCKAILSSVFESSIGKSALVFLASLVNSSSAHGLAPGAYLNNDVVNDPFPIVKGKINFNSQMYPPKFNFFK
jgi:o-succinylbenzoate synthase